MSTIGNYNEADKKTIRNILNNYVQCEKTLVNQLYFKVTHGTTIGGFREDIWRGMFEQIIPKKFVIEQSVFIIDSKGRVSNEVDLAIFDETYTPYIFRYGRLKFLPIEAVAVAIECKSASLDQERLEKWVASIAALETSCKSYARIYTEIATGEKKACPTQSATRPLRILCCLNEKIKNENLTSSKDKLFDIIVKAPSADQGLTIVPDDDKKNLKSWYHALNHAGKPESEDNNVAKEVETINISDYQVNYIEPVDKRKNTSDNQLKLVSLLTFNLQLNQILMLINNPMLFPHKAYAEMFDAIGREKDDQ